MDVRSLQCFLAVAEELHFGRAATRLHMSQPPLSQQIQRLEASLGVRLFDRNKRSVKLTSAGAALVSEARLILKQIRNATEVVKRAEQGRMDHIRVGFVSSAILAGLGKVVQSLQTTDGDLVETWIEIGSAEQVEALRQDRIDVGFAHTPLDYAGMKALPLMYLPLMVALPSTHPATARRLVRLTELEGEPFLIGPRDGSPGFYDQVHALCNEAGFTPQVTQQGRQVFSLLNLVGMRLGVALVPSPFQFVSMPGVVVRSIEGPGRGIELSVLWNPKNESAGVKKVLASLREHVATSQRDDARLASVVPA
jgi:DNA-binding transcriptional LysR family regulator